MQRYHVVAHATVALLLDIDIAHAYILIMGLLQTVEVETGIIAHKGLDDLSGQEITIVGSMVAEKHLQFSSLLQYDEHAAVHHQVVHLTLCVSRSGFQDIYYLNGTFHLNVLGHIDQHAVLGKHGVQCRHTVFGSLGQLGIIAFHDFRVLPHRTDDNALGK